MPRPADGGRRSRTTWGRKGDLSGRLPGPPRKGGSRAALGLEFQASDQGPGRQARSDLGSLIRASGWNHPSRGALRIWEGVRGDESGFVRDYGCGAGRLRWHRRTGSNSSDAGAVGQFPRAASTASCCSASLTLVFPVMQLPTKRIPVTGSRPSRRGMRLSSLFWKYPEIDTRSSCFEDIPRGAAHPGAKPGTHRECA